MTDSIPLTARQFADYYGISRERLSRIIAISLREHGGVFGLVNLGYFRAEMVDQHRMEITQYTATRAEQESILQYPLKGRLSSIAAESAASGSNSAPVQTPSASADSPTKYELELRVLQERATALRQKNVLEQARLRDETVSYCSTAIQLILTSLRSDLDALRLDSSTVARLRSAIDAALDDLNSVLPAIIAGTPVERIELELSARRAARISAARATSSTSEAERTAAVED